MLLRSQEGVKVVGIEQAITARYQIEELVKCLGALTDHFGLEIANEDLNELIN